MFSELGYGTGCTKEGRGRIQGEKTTAEKRIGAEVYVASASRDERATEQGARGRDERHADEARARAP